MIIGPYLTAGESNLQKTLSNFLEEVLVAYRFSDSVFPI